LNKKAKIILTLSVISIILLSGCAKETAKIIQQTPKQTPQPTINGILAGKIESRLEKLTKEIDGNQVSFNYVLKNKKEKEEKFDFSSSCQYKYEVKNSKGIVVDPISTGCTASLTSFILKPSNEKIMDINLNDLKEGKYTIDVWLITSDDKQEYKQSLAFEITAYQVQFKKEGIYTGQIDNNSIEVKSNNIADSYRLTDTSREDIKRLKDNDKVGIIYTKSIDGQFILARIYSGDGVSYSEEANNKTDSNNTILGTQHGSHVTLNK
jgi:hypothetical protein